MICPKCKAAFTTFASASEQMECHACKQCYPNVASGIPVLMADPGTYLAKLFLNYERYLREQDAELKRLASQTRAGKGRADTLLRMQTAIRHNSAYIRTIQRSLLPHLSVSSVTDVMGTTEVLPHIATWDYLRRDWCWYPEGELEVRTIEAFVLNAMSDYAIAPQSAVVIGAGAGRIAWDLSERLEFVYAIDASFTMAYQFHDLFESNISFFEINCENIYDVADAVRPLEATLAPDEGSEYRAKHRRARLAYFVADGLNVPVADHSVSAVVSVYFTDLVPIARYMDEVQRLLAPGGLFIHFGPLEYRLPDVNDALSAQEIREVFKGHSFAIVLDERIRTSQLASALSMQSKVYDAWAFVAVNENSPARASSLEVTWDSVVSIIDEVVYETRGVLSRDGESVLETKLVLPNGEKYEGAISALDVLRTIDGSRTIGEIAETLARRYEIPQESRQNVLEFMKTLVSSRTLRLAER